MLHQSPQVFCAVHICFLEYFSSFLNHHQVCSSQKLKEIMKKITCLGNTSNQGTGRG